MGMRMGMGLLGAKGRSPLQEAGQSLLLLRALVGEWL